MQAVAAETHVLRNVCMYACIHAYVHEGTVQLPPVAVYLEPGFVKR